jgi:hypothetical protein
MALFVRFGNLPLEARVNVYESVPLVTTRHEIRTQQGRVTLITQGIDTNLRLVDRAMNADIERYLMFRGPHIWHRGPNIRNRIPRMKIEGRPWDLLAARCNNRWQGILVAALDWFMALRNNFNAPIRTEFRNWLQTADRLGPAVQAASERDRAAIIKWVYQAGFALATDAVVTLPAEPDYDPTQNMVLILALMYNIQPGTPEYNEPESDLYPRLQSFAHEIGIVCETAHTALQDEEPAVHREFAVCDPHNFALLEEDEDQGNTWGVWGPDLAFWRDFVLLELPSAGAGPPPLPQAFTVLSGVDEVYNGETMEGSEEEYMEGWGTPP